MTLLALAAIVYGWVVAGQFLSAALSKVSAFAKYVAQVGSRSFAMVVVAFDLVVTVLAVWAPLVDPVSFAGIATLFLIAALYRAIVVLRPDQEFCACSVAARRTGWVDVAAHLVMAAGAIGLFLSGTRRPVVASVAITAAWCIMVAAAWGRRGWRARRAPSVASAGLDSPLRDGDGTVGVDLR